MDALLDSLGGLLIQALPTLILLLLLHLYLKWAFYKPLDRVLRKRWEATEGARKAADESLAKAEQKATEYEEAIRNARADLFKEQEQTRRRLQQEQQVALDEARAGIEAKVKAEKATLSAEAEAARTALANESESLAEDIARSLLERRAS